MQFPPEPGAGVFVFDSDLEQAKATKATNKDMVINFFMWSSFDWKYLFIV